MTDLTIRCCYDRDSSVCPDAVRNLLEGTFGRLIGRHVPLRTPVRHDPRTDTDNAERLAERIVATILDAAGVRAATSRSDANRVVLERRVACDIRRLEPVAAHMLWSPEKHWVAGAENTVDLAELAALNTLGEIRDAVRQLYEPGLALQFDVEDLEFEFMEGSDPDLAQARARYILGLRQLVEVLGLGDAFSVSRVSEQAANNAELGRWRSQMAENYRALEAYWYESERVGIERGDGLPSYQALCDLGWIGPIPLDMRRHYLDRLGSVPLGEERARVAMVLRNLATILLHRQEGIATGRARRATVKFSFIPPARGAPSAFLTGRVDLRFVPRRICSCIGAAGPWSTKGYVRHRHGRMTLAFAGWHDARTAGAKFVEGRLVLARNGEAAEVRADYLLA